MSCLYFVRKNAFWRIENMMTYPIEVAGVKRELPLCKITDDLYIGAFICFGDAEITVACARELLKLVPADSYDYLLTAEAKSIPIIHEMARQTGAKKYFIARKGAKAYMPDPLWVEDESITTAGKQKLFLGRDDADLIRGKRILIVDDVISTGGSLKAMEALITAAGGVVVDRLAVLAEGGAKDRTDIKFLAPLPLFNADGTVK
jgi:adenine phosphoribosyltransferase